MSLNQIIVWIVVGAVAGFLANLFVGHLRLGPIGTILVGILGAFIGGWLLGALHVSLAAGLPGDVISAFIGAALLLLALRALRRL